jgi:hypothetical protein
MGMNSMTRGSQACCAQNASGRVDSLHEAVPALVEARNRDGITHRRGFSFLLGQRRRAERADLAVVQTLLRGASTYRVEDVAVALGIGHQDEGDLGHLPQTSSADLGGDGSRPVKQEGA